MTDANYRTFSGLYSTINPRKHDLFQYRLRSANSYTTAKTMEIKLPVPIIYAKTLLSSSTLHRVRTSQKNYLINGLLFQDHILKFHDFQHLSPNSGQKINFSTFQDPWEPC